MKQNLHCTPWHYIVSKIHLSDIKPTKICGSNNKSFYQSYQAISYEVFKATSITQHIHYLIVLSILCHPGWWLKGCSVLTQIFLPWSYEKTTQIQVSQGHFLLPAHAHPHYLDTSPTQQSKGMIICICTWWSESTQRGRYSWFVTSHILNTIASVTLQNKSCWEELCLVQSLHPNIHVSLTHRTYISCTQPY